MSDTVIELGRRAFAPLIGEALRDARRLVGWTQRELAERSHASQSMISRIEGGRPAHLDLAVVERAMASLGIRASVVLDSRHLADRQRQLDFVHARLVGHVVRRLTRAGWRTAVEVPLRGDRPRGWIDLLAFREADGALIVDETKTDVPDLGALGRSLGFYEREARAAAAGLGWRARSVTVLVTALDSAALGGRLVANRELVGRLFPVPLRDVAAWLADPVRERPGGWALGMVDPVGREAAWLRPTLLGSRRRPAYEDYADAAARLRGGRTGP